MNAPDGFRTGMLIHLTGKRKKINLQTRVRRIQEDILLSTTSQIMGEMRKKKYELVTS